jgi:hypothetical protein
MYLRKSDVATRYATTPRNIERMVKDGRLPQPDFYNGRMPLWSKDRLDEIDRHAAATGKMGSQLGA